MGAHQIPNMGTLWRVWVGADALQIALAPPRSPSWKRAQLLGSDSRPAAPPVEKPAFNLDVPFLSPWKSLCGTN